MRLVWVAPGQVGVPSYRIVSINPLPQLLLISAPFPHDRSSLPCLLALSGWNAQEPETLIATIVCFNAIGKHPHRHSGIIRHVFVVLPAHNPILNYQLACI